MSHKILLSVIVPVYNVAPYLRDCLDSLLAQGFSEEEYEVIVVDDGSTDTSLEIIQKYAREHRCIKCIHQNNAGVSAARNTGLDHATGEYIAFVDGDDFLVAGALKRLCDEAERTDADMLIYKHFCVQEDAHFCHTIGAGVYNFSNNVSGTVRSTATIWCFLCKRDLIERNHIRFPVGMKYGEDSFFAGSVSMCVQPERQVVCDAAIYCYRQRLGSAMHSKGEETRIKHMNDMIASIDAWSVFLAKHPDLSDSKKRNIRHRQYLLSAAACLDALRSTEIDPYEVKDCLVKKGVYPYPHMPYFFRPPRNIPNIIKCFLRFKIVFAFLARTKLLNGR